LPYVSSAREIVRSLGRQSSMTEDNTAECGSFDSWGIFLFQSAS
jgi:hypothetical protein